MRKRSISIHFLLLFSLTLLLARLYYISTGADLATQADMQRKYILELGNTRGILYDSNMLPLTNSESYKAVAVVPTPEAARALANAVAPSDRGVLAERLQNMMPFVMPTLDKPVYAKGVENITLTKRYSDSQIAAHLIGYTDQNGAGLTGLELALNDKLIEQGGSLSLRAYTDASRRPIDGSTAELLDNGYYSGRGVVLTIDAEMQRIAENAARTIEKGSVVVMDAINGDIKAMVSLPNYNPNNVEQYLSDENSPLINRSLYDYAVGSSFKMLVAATALEQGIPVGYTYDCKGYIDVDGQRFHCHYLNGHGTLDMEGALQKSCNPYFVNLARVVGSQSIAYKAEQLGFGAPVILSDGYSTRPGVLPSKDEINAPGRAANFAFGQGTFSATPVHIAAMVATIANGGQTVSPRVVIGYSDSGEKVDEYLPIYGSSRVISQSAANRVKDLLVSVVTNGSGRSAQPEEGGAGGKTASAETGIFDEDGNQIIHAWFVGFFPAQRPRYVIVVLNEGGDSGSEMACPIFKEIADNINLLNARRGTDKGESFQ